MDQARLGVKAMERAKVQWQKVLLTQFVNCKKELCFIVLIINDKSTIQLTVKENMCNPRKK